MHYGHLIRDAVPGSAPAVLHRLAIDGAARALHFDGELAAHPDDARRLRGVLAAAASHHRTGTPTEAALRAEVDAIWDDIDGFIERKTGSSATAVGWAASAWESVGEIIQEALGEARWVGASRAVPPEIRRAYRFYASDNEELWQARRLEALEAMYVEDALWSFAEAEIEATARLDFDPIEHLRALIAEQRALPMEARRRLPIRFAATSDDGWFAYLGPLVVCVSGTQELLKVECDAVVADEGSRVPLQAAL
ncbi:MAG: hypothetical protein KC486_30255 [Myxococcales bacterium]|nr:hypothetical protein [Myxococcales bacterium]